MARDGDKADSNPEDADLTFADKVKRELHEWGVTLAVFVPIFMLFSGLLYEQRVIPSESMVPTLQVSDRVAVAKFAYGYDRYSLPFSLGRYLPRSRCWKLRLRRRGASLRATRNAAMWSCSNTRTRRA